MKLGLAYAKKIVKVENLHKTIKKYRKNTFFIKKMLKIEKKAEPLQPIF